MRPIVTGSAAHRPLNSSEATAQALHIAYPRHGDFFLVVTKIICYLCKKTVVMPILFSKSFTIEKWELPCEINVERHRFCP